jgi:hypothetical protein
LAIKYGYLDGNLKGSTDPQTALPLPPEYITEAKAVAEQQGALSGYRLADEIREYLKVGKFVPLLPPNTNIVAEVLPKEIGAAQAANYYYQAVEIRASFQRCYFSWVTFSKSSAGAAVTAVPTAAKIRPAGSRKAARSVRVGLFARSSAAFQAAASRAIRSKL